MGDGRAEGLSAIGDRGQAAISLTSDVVGTHICIFERHKVLICRGLTVPKIGIKPQRKKLLRI